mmetsp:Transcript_17606/g.51136  ORF Transcript_17606/g.51136 Transcript_17606/m.51136 type:complete len:261 (-) Transcript_17606:605-1387(-)
MTRTAAPLTRWRMSWMNALYSSIFVDLPPMQPSRWPCSPVIVRTTVKPSRRAKAKVKSMRTMVPLSRQPSSFRRWTRLTASLRFMCLSSDVFLRPRGKMPALSFPSSSTSILSGPTSRLMCAKYSARSAACKRLSSRSSRAQCWSSTREQSPSNQRLPVSTKALMLARPRCTDASSSSSRRFLTPMPLVSFRRPDDVMPELTTIELLCESKLSTSTRSCSTSSAGMSLMHSSWMWSNARLHATHLVRPVVKGWWTPSSST